MRYVATSGASQLTGLSTEKLREWTSRRALIPADVRPRQKGSPAKFTWQTILVLRVASRLRNQFNVELEAHKAFFADFRASLRRTSFIALWGNNLALEAGGGWSLVASDSPVVPVDAIVLQLDPHLAVIRDGFALPDPAAVSGQFDLFSLPNLHARSARPKAAAGGRVLHRRSA